MFEVSVTGKFVAAHQLREPDGSTEPLHEHVWHVKVTYAGGKLDKMGLLVDFGVLRSRLNELMGVFDEQDLNRLPLLAGRNPSAENVALYLAGQLPGELPGAVRLKCVEIEEEPGCAARYFPPARC